MGDLLTEALIGKFSPWEINPWKGSQAKPRIVKLDIGDHEVSLLGAVEFVGKNFS